MEDFLGEHMIFMGDQSLPTGCKRWGGGTVESCLPFYCHQGEGGHKNTKELGGGYQVNFFMSQPNSFNERNSLKLFITELKQIRPFEISFLTCSQISVLY